MALLIEEVGGGVGGGGGVDATGGATCKSLLNAGFSRNRRCRGPGRREVSVLGLTAAEVSGAADRPTEVSASGAGAIPVGTGRLIAGRLIEGAEAPNCGELTEGTALAGASGGEGGVGFLSSVWGMVGEGFDWAWLGLRVSLRAGELSGGCWIKL